LESRRRLDAVKMETDLFLLSGQGGINQQAYFAGDSSSLFFFTFLW
jgi:hypothetical protein